MITGQAIEFSIPWYYLIVLTIVIGIEENNKYVPTIYVLSKNKKNIKIFSRTFSSFKDKKNLCFFVMEVIGNNVGLICPWNTDEVINKGVT